MYSFPNLDRYKNGKFNYSLYYGKNIKGFTQLYVTSFKGALKLKQIIT